MSFINNQHFRVQLHISVRMFQRSPSSWNCHHANVHLSQCNTLHKSCVQCTYVSTGHEHTNCHTPTDGAHTQTHTIAFTHLSICVTLFFCFISVLLPSPRLASPLSPSRLNPELFSWLAPLPPHQVKSPEPEGEPGHKPAGCHCP